MAANTPVTLSFDQSKKLLEYAKSCALACTDDVSAFRSLLEHRDRVYQRSLYVTQEQINQRTKPLGSVRPRMSDIDVPIAMPQVESATAYQAGVFCTSYPIFGVVSENDPKSQGAALQFESVLAQQSLRHGWARELIKIFRDGNKYNFGVGVVEWVSENLSKFVTSADASIAGMAQLKNYNYGANRIKHVSPYNCFMDTSVNPSDICRSGEFFGHNEMMSRIALKQYLGTLDTTKTRQFNEAFESTFASVHDGSPMAFFVPKVNPHVTLHDKAQIEEDWGRWMGLESEARKIAYKNRYLVTHFYCRALPSDFGASGNIPEVYRAIIINWQHVVFVERIISSHNLLPVMIAQPDEDGLNYQTQSLIDTTAPFQDMSSALWNMTLEGKRRAIFDRLLYHPRMINKADIDPANPIARIPLRNAALVGDKSISQAIYQIPYRDDNSMAGVQLAAEVGKLADDSTGQNRVARGQFQKGNKTTTEFETTQNNSNARQQFRCIGLEHSFMGPVKEVIKANTLQFQTAAKILDQNKKQAVEVDPVALREAMLEFTLTDGVLPADKILSPEMMQVFLQTMQAMPMLTTEYDVMGMFTWWLQAKGARWLDTFKRTPEQQQSFLDMARQTSATDPRVVAAQQQAQMQQQPQSQLPPTNTAVG